MNIGNCELSSSPTTERSDCGHVSGAPGGEPDQSCVRINAPVLSPPARDSVAVERRAKSVDCIRSNVLLFAATPQPHLTMVSRVAYIVGWSARGKPRRSNVRHLAPRGPCVSVVTRDERRRKVR